MTKAREIAELGQKLTVDGSGNLDIAGTGTFDGLTTDGNITNNAGLKIKGYYSNASGDGYNANLGVTGNETYLQSMNGNATNSLNLDGSTIKFRSGTFDEAMRIHSTGNVTIGGNADMGAPLLIYKVDSTAYDAGQDDGQDGVGATIMAWNSDQADNGFAQILFRNRGSGVGISRIVSLSQGSGTTDLAFVTEHGNVKSEKMRITSDGKLGLGDTNPDTKLHVEELDSGNSKQLVSLVNPGGNSGSGARLWLSGTNATTRGAYIEGQSRSTGNNHDMIFATSAVSSTPSERMRLTHDGLLGIGVTDPDKALHVKSGTNNSDIARFTGDQASNGLLISTFSSGGNDRGVTLEAPDRINFETNDTLRAYVNDNGLNVPHGQKVSFSTKSGYSRSSGGSAFSIRIGRMDGIGSRARIEVTGSRSYGDHRLSQIVVEAGQGNASDEFGLNIYNIGQSAPDLSNNSSDFRFYTDRIDGDSYDIWMWVGSFARIDIQVTEQTGFTQLFDQSSGTGVSVPATAVETNNERVTSVQADVVNIRKADGSVIARFDPDGLKFGTDTAAANGLSDYEEGTWTPSPISGSGFTIATNRGCTYTKIGRMVHITANLSLDYSGSNGNVQVEITGLPFTPKAGNAGRANAQPWVDYVDTGVAGTIQAGIWDASNRIRHYVTRTDSNSNQLSLTANDLNSSSNTEYQLNITYLTE